MCDPVSLTVAATVATAGATVYGGVQQYNQGRYEAAVQNRNALLADRAERDALARGEKELQDHWRKVAALKGQQQAAMAANGVDLSFGSPLDVQTDTAFLAYEDAETIAANTYNEAQGYRIQAANNRAGAAASKSRATGALAGSVLQAGGTILSGASQVKGMQTKYGSKAKIG